MSLKEDSLQSANTAPKKPRKVASVAKKAPTKVPVLPNVISTPQKVSAKKVPTRRKQKGAVLSSIQLAATAKSTKKGPTKATLGAEESVVALPHTMSIRAREKALAILQKMTEDFEFSAQKVAYVSGFCFIAFGGALSLLSGGFLPSVTHQLSQVISSVTSSTLPTTNQVLTEAVPLPVFTIITALPQEPRTISDASFTVTNADNVEAHFYNIDAQKLISVTLDQPALGMYHFKVNPADLLPGHYVTNIRARALADQSIQNYRAFEFVILAPTLTTTSGTSGGTTTATPSTSGTVAASTTQPTTATTTLQTAVATTTAVEKLELKLVVPSSPLSGDATLKVYAPLNTFGVEFYIRQTNTNTSAQPVRAIKNSGYWYYMLDTRNRPNGEYEVFARAKVSDLYIISQSIKVKIENVIEKVAAIEPPVATEQPVVAPTNTVPATTVEPVTPVVVAKPTVPVTVIQRSFVDTTTSETAPDVSEELVQPLSKEAQDIFVQNREELTKLFERYAVAVQSGNQLTIQIALKELETARKRIIGEVLENQDIKDMAGKIDLEFSDRLSLLKSRVETFEKLRTNAGADDTHTDTDGDGVSDFDEVNLYHTDARQTDTDHDGFMDGTEIMKGFDPRDAKPEATITYEMPQESLSLVHDDILKIQDVKPFVRHNEEGQVEEVQAEIRGKALPNSFVTLYIFSTPVVVTVRTDNDGSFVYNFEKELEDGQHEVYVAVTDNTGAIVARSNPFKFVKEAQAFTPVDTANAEAVDSQSLADFKLLNMYNVAVGLGILALGLILLMLGIGLRKKSTAEIIVTP